MVHRSTQIQGKSRKAQSQGEELTDNDSVLVRDAVLVHQLAPVVLLKNRVVLRLTKKTIFACERNVLRKERAEHATHHVHDWETFIVSR